MRSAAYTALCAVRSEFRSLVERWTAEHPYLRGLQEQLRAKMGYDDYSVETPIVYNEALDEITAKDRIRFILVADNPGKSEQLAANRRYLVGQSGKLAASWFARELGVDFRREVLILNKTPVHTPKTAELRRLLALAGPRRAALSGLLEESQRAMANLAWRLYLAFGAGKSEASAILWISGRGELRRGGIFEVYREGLARLAAASPRSARRRFWAFNHFSMNQFAIELKRKAESAAGIWQNLERIGSENRDRILDFDAGGGA